MNNKALLKFNKILHKIYHVGFRIWCWFEGHKIVKQYAEYPWTLIMFETDSSHRMSRPSELYLLLRSHVPTNTHGQMFLTKEEAEDGFFETCIESLEDYGQIVLTKEKIEEDFFEDRIESLEDYKQ